MHVGIDPAKHFLCCGLPITVDDCKFALRGGFMGRASPQKDRKPGEMTRNAPTIRTQIRRSGLCDDSAVAVCGICSPPSPVHEVMLTIIAPETGNFLWNFNTSPGPSPPSEHDLETAGFRRGNSQMRNAT